MEQLRLPLYHSDGPLDWDDTFCFEREAVFTALLLELGPPPVKLTREEILTTFGDVPWLDYYLSLENALAKYYRASCPLPYSVVVTDAVDGYLQWIDSYKQ